MEVPTYAYKFSTKYKNTCRYRELSKENKKIVDLKMGKEHLDKELYGYKGFYGGTEKPELSNPKTWEEKQLALTKINKAHIQHYTKLNAMGDAKVLYALTQFHPEKYVKQEN